MRNTPVKPAMLLAIALCLVLAAVAIYVRFARGSAQQKAPEPPTMEEELAHIGEDRWGTYSFSLELDDVVNTDVYHFAGNRIQLTMGAYRSGAEQGTSEYLSVELHLMSVGVFDVLIGTQTLSRWGSSHATWDGLEEGDYYFRFVKDADGQRVNAQSVQAIGYMVYE